MLKRGSPLHFTKIAFQEEKVLFWQLLLFICSIIDHPNKIGTISPCEYRNILLFYKTECSSADFILLNVFAG